MRTAALSLFFLLPLCVAAQDIRVGEAIGPANVRPGQVLAPGEMVVSGAGGRIDLYIDPSVHLRLYPNLEAHVSRSPDGWPRIDVVHGEILSGVVDLAPVNFEIGTPQVAVRPDMPGSVRVVVDPLSESEIDALTCDVDVVAMTGSRRLRMGQKMFVRGTAANPEFKIVDAVTFTHPPAVVAIDVVRVVRNGSRSAPLAVPLPTLPTPAPSTNSSSSSSTPATGLPARSSAAGRGK